MFNAQSKCNLTGEERSFLDTAHLDVQDVDSDDVNFDVDNDFTPGNCAADATAVIMSTGWSCSGQLAGASKVAVPDVAGGVHAADASREHLAPVEEQDNPQASASGSRSKDKYSVGDLVYFHRPANLGGVAGLASLAAEVVRRSN